MSEELRVHDLSAVVVSRLPFVGGSYFEIAVGAKARKFSLPTLISSL